MLRMTTLHYALPDGTPVQRVGLRPDIALTLPKPHDVKDHEADLPRAPPTWSGPDVRDAARIAEVPWHRGSSRPLQRRGGLPGAARPRREIARRREALSRVRRSEREQEDAKT